MRLPPGKAKHILKQQEKQGCDCVAGTAKCRTGFAADRDI